MFESSVIATVNVLIYCDTNQTADGPGHEQKRIFRLRNATNC